MNKYNYVLVAIIFITACQFQKRDEINRYNFTYAEDEKYELLELSKFKTYRNLTELIERTVCKDIIPIISFQDKKIEKRLKPVNMCERIKWDPKLRDIITINENNRIIKSGKSYDLNSMGRILAKDFNNTDQNPEYSLFPNKIIIIINQKPNSSIEDLEKILNVITNAHENIKIEEELKLLLNYPIEVPMPAIKE